MREPVSYCFLKPNAVGSDFLSFMKDFTEHNLHLFNANTKGAARLFYRFDSRDGDLDWPMLELKEELARHFNLGEYQVPPKLKDFIGYITEGGSIHTHTDPDVPGKRHVRINVLLNQSGGCIPLLEGLPIAIPVGAAWLNLASKCPHGTTEVEGPGYRSAVSFGYQIDPARGDELYEIHRQWRDKMVDGAAPVAA